MVYRTVYCILRCIVFFNFECNLDSSATVYTGIISVYNMWDTLFLYAVYIQYRYTFKKNNKNNK